MIDVPQSITLEDVIAVCPLDEVLAAQPVTREKAWPAFGTMPASDFLPSWRLERGYFTETDEEIEEREQMIHNLEFGTRTYTWNKEIMRWDVSVVGVWRNESWQFWGKKRWEVEMGLVKKTKSKSFVDKDEILTSCPIDEIVRGYVKLIPSGPGTFKGLCPFHNEKTPSFFVNTRKGFFHCFGCSKGGNVIKFVELIEDCSFFEALKMLENK